MEALSPRSANLPMKPPTAVKKTKVDTRAKPAQSGVNPDKIDEKWRPAAVIKEPEPEGDTYLTGKKLGRGGFAVCFEGRSERTAEIFALKVVKSHVEQKKQLEKFRTELQIHAKMHHPSIVEFYRAFAFENYTYVVLELCPNGSLMDMVKNRKSLSLPEVRRYMIQLCGGVKYMHQRCVIHRDLKMGNIFMDCHMNIKIGDFGLAAVVVDDKERRRTMCGTPNYIAPELLGKKGALDGHGNKVDTWAIGIICYAMLIGTPPFASKSQTEIYEKLKQLQYEWKEDCQYFIPNQAKNLVTLCLNLNPTERPGMDDLVEHEFFKMGAIAEELDRSCLRSRPLWLEHADPRGDKVTPGYGVVHAAICEISGVGKTSTGQSRPAVGGNVNVSAMVEVELENANGCAPAIPMPEGVIYKEFVAAKEEWNASRKRPLTVPKIRGRRAPASSTDKLDMQLLSEALPETATSRSVSTTTTAPTFAAGISQALQHRAPVQSFAAQQRQQALSSRAISRTVAPSQLTSRVASTREGRAHSTRELQPKEASSQTGRIKTRTADPASQNSQGFLREQPVRAGARVTRSTSIRDTPKYAVDNASENATVPDRREIRTAESAQEQQRTVRTRPARTTTANRTEAQPRPKRRNLSREITADQEISARSSSSSGSEAASRPLAVIGSNDLKPKKALLSSTRSRAQTAKAVGSLSATPARATIFAPTDITTPVPGSSVDSVLNNLQEICHDLSINDCIHEESTNRFRGVPSTAHPIVEKWVDYTERYGIGYLLSDGAAGAALKSSMDNARSSCCVVIRNSREHYRRRTRQEEVQIVPQGPQATPVEFYETFAKDGIRKASVPAEAFHYDQARPWKWIDGREVVASLSQQAKDDHAAERLKLLGLLDRFGKYMTNLNAMNTEETKEARVETFIRFYQRFGNVGAWGFGDGSFQFNFPDHTKLLFYRSGKDHGHGLMMDLYHLQPEDAKYLAKYGSFMERSMERRGSFTVPVSGILGGSETRYVDIIKSNQVHEKLSWIRDVFALWIREGGLGRTGNERLVWTGLRLKKVDRGNKNDMVWVTVGRDGGDGEVIREK
ncbi:hypothetical protein GJ744_006073 [Endocarpon pusillum]|uniref:Protein kinase domain-containing protein n=1 Tax=Endocarpon pusillum TaxID=364733 RepID=A0A8H7AME2_9EURO|nr:hypothetical protein GJ744_006073 [Endocarpon pusillum]